METTANKYTTVNVFTNIRQTKKTIRFNAFGIEIYNSNILIYGKYLKYIREIYQTEYRGVQGVNSFLKYLKVFYNSDVLIFSALGREDLDVMNLTGRDFILKVVNPKKNIYCLSPENRYNIEGLNSNFVAFYNFKVVDSRIETMYKSSPLKEYKCTIVAETRNALKNISLSGSFFSINQKTPLRVLHRRADLTRPKEILITNLHFCKSNIYTSADSCFKNIDEQSLNKILTEVKNGSMSAQTIDLSKFGDYIRPDEYFFLFRKAYRKS